MITIKNERGITLIAVVLTIVIMLILTTITVKTGIGSIEESRMISFVSKMQLLQKKVDFLAENGGYEDLGEDLDESKLAQLKTVIESEKLDTPIRVLPNEYKQVEYIESTGTQWIDTLISANRIKEIDVKFNIKKTNDHQGIVGGGYASTNNTFQVIYNYSANRINARWGEYTTGIDYDENIHTVKLSQENVLIDDKVQGSGTAVNDNRTVILFARHTDNMGEGIQNYSKCKIYYCKIYETNGTIHEYIPCFSTSNNKPGLYDIINNAFYTNASTNGNDFDIGNQVINANIVKYFNGQAIANDLGIDNIDDEIIVDFATRQIVSLNGIEYEGKMHYSQYNLPGGQKVKQGEEEVRQLDNVSVTPTINGLNATWTISGIEHTNGTLSYSRDNKKTWTQITNYTIAGEDVTTENITQSGTYYFKWTDNTNKNNEYLLDVVQLRLVNSPQLRGDLEDLSEKYNYSSLDSATWAYATDKKGTPDDLTDDEVYVWIPRFAYEENNTTNIEFLRGTSNVTTSENYLPETGWIIPEPLKDVTGVWAHIPDLEPLKSGLDIIDILKNTNLTIYNAE